MAALACAQVRSVMDQRVWQSWECDTAFCCPTAEEELVEHAGRVDGHLRTAPALQATR